MISLDVWLRNVFFYLSCLYGKGCLIDICCFTQNAALFVSLLYNLFCLYLVYTHITHNAYTSVRLNRVWNIHKMSNMSKSQNNFKIYVSPFSKKNVHLKLSTYIRNFILVWFYGGLQLIFFTSNLLVVPI